MTKQRDIRLAAIIPARMTHAEAAKTLGLSEKYLYEIAERNDLQRRTNDGLPPGPGKRVYYLRGEVLAFAEGGALAAKAWRESRAAGEPKIKKPRRGRRAKVA